MNNRLKMKIGNTHSSIKLSYLKWITILICIVSTIPANGQSDQQVKIINGLISDTENTPIIGASIGLKGTSKGTVSNYDGVFKVKAKKGDILMISYIGMKATEIQVDDRDYYNITLKNDHKLVDEVVVTALGIKRHEKSLTYATQKVDGKSLSAIPSKNFVTSLAGRTSGLNITTTGSGLGSSSKVILRGLTSIAGNNQPLYVIDGVPMANPIFNQVEGGDGFGGGVDTGDGISSINPDDIESVNILKGASAAALYGSKAGNGVILITTKSGKKGAMTINFNSSVQFDKVNHLIDFQNSYLPVEGEELGGANWGKQSNFTDTHVEDFFNTGLSFTNRVSFSSGSEKRTSYVSYANSNMKGIVPQNTLDKHNLTIKTSSKYLNDKLKIGARVNLMKQKIEQAPSTPGEYYNPIFSLYRFPRGIDFTSYKHKYQYWDDERKIYNQNWPYKDKSDNPYWIINKIEKESNKKRGIVNLDIALELTKWATIKARGNIDNTIEEKSFKAHAGTMKTLAKDNGKYSSDKIDHIESYGDILLLLNHKFEKIQFNGTLGSSIEDIQHTTMSINGHPSLPNVFSPGALENGGGHSEKKTQRQTQSIFGAANIGYDDMFFLDVTCRKDWSSTLPKDEYDFFYPSIGGSFIFTKLTNDQLLGFINFGKIRASWTRVGNSVPFGVTSLESHSVDRNGNITLNDAKPFTDLKPEITTSKEFGLDLRMFDNRLSMDACYYIANTENQFFKQAAVLASGYKTYYINAGDIQNEGIELTINTTPIQSNNLQWNSNINFTKNINKVISLPENYREEGFRFSGYSSTIKAKEGEPIGKLYAKVYMKNNGKYILAQKNNDDPSEGYTLMVSGKDEYIGNINPDFTLGWNNSIRYKNFSLSFLINASIGGKVLSATQHQLSKNGLTEETAKMRNNGGFKVNGMISTGEGKYRNVETTISAKDYYSSVPIGEFLYDATNIRLQEASFTYSFSHLFGENAPIKGLDISFIGRNLLFFYIDAPFDPSIASSATGIKQLNTDHFGLPATRNIGFSLNIKF
ncbi:SusC/RagA family TonB-linked outer membrane protein [Halosquirtibacter xylanolyticus]|uniref:SusC/RagA family TonB-linked outer membrane protein n=1 Tax=Halosquirtibacter xylanolyticus TaxID=3374599 RepID=UPI003748B186|nr:SusC/RagA family TonB-linked outer membrane protein [Prolixibacteraceae bacterium]